MAEDPFVLLGLEPRFDLGVEQIDRAWLVRSARAHPDRAGDPVQAAEAVRATALLNEARRILRDPFLRAEALLDRRATLAEGRAAALPQAFLAEMMERRERLEDASASSDRGTLDRELEDLREERRRVLELVGTEFARTTAAPDSATAGRIRTALHVIRTLDRLLEEWRTRRESSP